MLVPNKRIIGIDFGNWMAYICTIFGMDPKTRMGGTVEDLIPAKYLNQGSAGIPNEYFWNMTTKDGKLVSNELMGFLAARDTNRPAENHLRLLKKHLGETINLYGGPNKTHLQTLSYDEIITKMFAYHVQLANDALRTNHSEKETTNLISITFPAKLRDPMALQYLINLAEKADSGAKDEAGKMLKIKVVGAVCEPAAAGLDRLNEERDHITADTVTYGTFDLGGGTFDLAIVSLFPKGRRYPSGNLYYYDLVCEGKGLNTAGSDFSNRLQKVFVDKATAELGSKPTDSQMRVINRSIERCKMELSDDTKTEIFIETDDDGFTIVVTRDEFLKAIKPDVDKIMSFTKEFFEEHKAHRPDEIVMTGGSSWIPYIRERLEETLPEYKGKIHLHRPSKAAAYGAARFYSMDSALEAANNTEHKTENQPAPAPKPSSAKPVVPPTPDPIVRKFVEYDIATKVRSDNELGYAMETLIRKGTVLPCDSGNLGFTTGSRFDRTDYDVFVATKDKPDPNHGNTDYRLLQGAELVYGRVVPKGTATTCRLTITELGVARLDAWMNDDTSIEIHPEFTINNKTDDSTK